MPEPLAQRVLLIGWDAADWQIASPLIDQGLMPTLAQFVNGGAMGNIATLQPVLSPMLWNSIGTGKRAFDHGIHGFTEPDPNGPGIRPTTSTSRKVKALWNILHQNGLRSQVTGWFAGHPAEPIRGVCVSPAFAQPSAADPAKWTVAEGSVHPERLRETLAGLRLHPADVPPDALLNFVPRAAEVDQTKDKRLSSVAKVLVECCSIHNAATYLLENEPWDFAAVYYNAIDHFCHLAMPFHPPRMEGVDETQFELYKDVVVSAYRFHDMMLERLLQLAGPETTVLIVSDHGFKNDHLRPPGIPDEPAGPASWHRDLGIFAIRGPHVRQDERIYGATLLDIAPTVLTLFGLPVGEDMPGKVLAQAFDREVKPEYIPSWESVPGDCGMHPPEYRMDPASAQALMEQFVALGYIKPPSEDQAKARAQSIRELSYNLARDYHDAGRPADAAPMLEQLVASEPAVARFRTQLASVYLALNRLDDAAGVLQPLVEKAAETPGADMLMGALLFRQDRAAEALVYLNRAEAADPSMPDLHLHIGNVYLKQRLWADAERAFQKAREIDPDSAKALLGLAIAANRRKLSRQAAEFALEAVGIQHSLPAGHFHLGVALARLGDWNRSALAFRTSLAQRPGQQRAIRMLALVLAAGARG